MLKEELKEFNFVVRIVKWPGMVMLHLAPLFHDHSSFVLCVLNRNFLPQKRLQMSCQNVFCTVIVMMKIEAAFRVNIMLADSANPGSAAIN